MMNEDGSEKSNGKDNKPEKKRGSFAIVISMMLIGTIIIAILSYQYFTASQSNVPVLEIEVEVDEVGDDVFIKKIELKQSERKMLDAPRIDDEGKIPGVRVKVIKGQSVRSYDSFVDYHGAGVYNIVSGFKETPEKNEILDCTVWVFSEESESYADDQETIQFIWDFEKADHFLKAKVNANGTFEHGSDANIRSVEITQEQRERDVDVIGYFPGIWGSAQRFNSQASNIVSVSYIGGASYNYTLYIGLLEEPQSGDEFTVTINVWPRDGEWLEHLYQQPADTFSVNYVWS
jgi:hypothetical protein